MWAAVQTWPRWVYWGLAVVALLLIVGVALGNKDNGRPVSVVGDTGSTVAPPPAAIAPAPPTEATTTTAPVTTQVPTTQATSTQPRAATTTSATTEAPTTVSSSVYYVNCTAVRAAGKAPLYRGEPGYRPGLDSDNDGVACER